MAYYIFNLVGSDATARLRAGMWAVDEGQPHRDALAEGDLVLIYLAAPRREFAGRAELASAAHVWTPAEAQAYPGDSAGGGVLLARVEEWHPPVPMSAVLSRIDTSAGARADFETGVVRITASEYEIAVSLFDER